MAPIPLERWNLFWMSEAIGVLAPLWKVSERCGKIFQKEMYCKKILITVSSLLLTGELKWWMASSVVYHSFIGVVHIYNPSAYVMSPTTWEPRKGRGQPDGRQCGDSAFVITRSVHSCILIDLVWHHAVMMVEWRAMFSTHKSHVELIRMTRQMASPHQSESYQGKPGWDFITF